MKKCVYTVITNDYCNLNDDNIKSKGWEYVCFTDDKNLKSRFWKIILIENNSKRDIEHIKLSRKYKTQGFKYLDKYDIFLYVDGRISIIKDLNEYLKRLDKNDILFNKHRHKNILEHFDCIEGLGYETPETINRIKQRYDQYGYKYDNGLIEGFTFLFKNNERSIKFFDDWWNEIKYYSHRDQLSANFAIFLNPELKYKIGENSVYGKIKYFKLLPRKSKRFKIKQ